MSVCVCVWVINYWFVYRLGSIQTKLLCKHVFILHKNVSDNPRTKVSRVIFFTLVHFHRVEANDSSYYILRSFKLLLK